MRGPLQNSWAPCRCDSRQGEIRPYKREAPGAADATPGTVNRDGRISSLRSQIRP